MTCVVPKLTLRMLVLTLLLSLPPAWRAVQQEAAAPLEPDPAAVFLTMVLQRNQPVSRRNTLILSSPPARAMSVTPRGDFGGMTRPPSARPLTFNFGSSLYKTGEVTTATSAQPEAQETIAADPSDPSGDRLVAAVSDFSRPGGFNFTRWEVSINGGKSWEEAFLPFDTGSGRLVTSDKRAWTANSDPMLAFDGSGRVFLSDLYIKINAQGQITAEGLYVSVDRFRRLESRNFARSNPVFTDLDAGNIFSLEDKPWIAVDRAGRKTAGYVYASWSHFTGCRNRYSALARAYELRCRDDVIYVAYSKDHGQTWSTPYTVNAPAQTGAVQGSQVAVGPDGKIYAAYELFGRGGRRQQEVAIGVWKDGSLSFGSPFPVTPVFHELTFSGCATCSAGYRVNSFPSLAVGPAGRRNPSGNVYLVYGAQATGSSRAQIDFVACTGACTRSKAFRAPRILNDVTTGEHFFPAIAVDPEGVIHSAWFDTRNHPSDPDSLDVYAAFLTYNADTDSFTLSPNARVTSSSNPVNQQYGWSGTDYIGDYLGIAVTASTPATVHPAWTSASGILGVPVAGSLETSTLSFIPARSPRP